MTQTNKSKRIRDMLDEHKHTLQVLKSKTPVQRYQEAMHAEQNRVTVIHPSWSYRLRAECIEHEAA